VLDEQERVFLKMPLEGPFAFRSLRVPAGFVQDSLKIISIPPGDVIPPDVELSERVIREVVIADRMSKTSRLDSLCCLDAARWPLTDRPRGQHRRSMKALTCSFYLVGATGFEPVTSSVSAKSREPLCGSPFPQVTRDRKGRS
jgi:hypothetical protein